MTITSEIQFSAVKGISLRQRWHCPVCEIQVTTYVTLSEPPTHTCKKQLSKTLPLKEKK